MRAEVATLSEALGLLPGHDELISIVGGGGKSALMFRLARELPGRSVLTTTTRIFADQIGRAVASCDASEAGLEAALAKGESGLLVVGRVEGDKAIGVEPELPSRLIADVRVDWVVVEADGSRMLPVKAPADHEPVVASGTTLLVVVAGIDALEGPIREVAHRPELVADVANASLDQALSPPQLAGLLCDERGGMKDAPTGARRVILLNKVESAHGRELAERVATCALTDVDLDRVVVGALKAGPEQGWLVYRRDPRTGAA